MPFYTRDLDEQFGNMEFDRYASEGLVLATGAMAGVALNAFFAEKSRIKGVVAGALAVGFGIMACRGVLAYEDEARHFGALQAEERAEAVQG